MTFNDGVRLDPGRVRTSRGSAGRGRRGATIGGGGLVGVIVLVLLSQLTGVDLTGLVSGDPAGGGAVVSDEGADLSRCTDAAAANADVDCRVIGALESLDAYWAQVLPGAGTELTLPEAHLFEQAVATACGDATSEVGPFYCPVDQTIYLDTGFFDELTSRFGASGGPLAQMYVVAHEYGHHVEQLLGHMDRADRRGTGPKSDSVRIELMADCLAGMWAGSASTVPDPDTGIPFLEPLTPGQVDDALSAASAVGDDRIQAQATGTVNPEAWTHGSSEQRRRWFLTGLEGGTLEQCDALAAVAL